VSRRFTAATDAQLDELMSRDLSELDLAAQLEARWPDAAASLREGLEDMFTVRRLGVGGRLAASLTNPTASRA
jgi:hypothetical protein